MTGFRKFLVLTGVNENLEVEPQELRYDIDKISTMIDKNGQHIFLTDDRDEAIEFGKNARKLYEKYYPDDADLLDCVQVLTSPICPTCKTVWKLGYTWCAECGDKLEEQTIDLERELEKQDKKES